MGPLSASGEGAPEKTPKAEEPDGVPSGLLVDCNLVQSLYLDNRFQRFENVLGCGPKAAFAPVLHRAVCFQQQAGQRSFVESPAMLVMVLCGGGRREVVAGGDEGVQYAGGAGEPVKNHT